MLYLAIYIHTQLTVSVFLYRVLATADDEGQNNVPIELKQETEVTEDLVPDVMRLDKIIFSVLRHSFSYGLHYSFLKCAYRSPCDVEHTTTAISGCMAQPDGEQSQDLSSDKDTER